MKKVIIFIIIILVLGLAIFLIWNFSKSTTESNKCEKIESMSSKANCYRQLAEQEGNKEICENIEGYIDIKDACLSQVAVKNQDAELCEQAGGQKDFCLGRVALLTQNELLCDKLSTELGRYACYVRIATKKKDKTICEKIDNPESDYYYLKENCYNNIE